MRRLNTNSVVIVPFLAIAFLLMLSLVDWYELSSGRLSSFNLVEDLVVKPIEESTSDFIDPLLVAAIDEVTSEQEMPFHQLEEQLPKTDLENEVLGTEVEEIVKPVVDIAPDRVDGILPIEDYTADGRGLRRFAEALAASDESIVRVAVIGDSYIEGDIFTQDIRRLLQQQYGGSGVGYMPMHCDFPGFRRSIAHSDNGWTAVDMRYNKNDSVRTIAGEHYVSSQSSTATYKTSKQNPTEWTRSTVAFMSAAATGQLKLKSAVDEKLVEIADTNCVQFAHIDGVTSRLTIATSVPGVKVLGAWLESPAGVSVDCMPLRGNSGATHLTLNRHIASQLSAVVGYDLIVIEYGMNVVSAEQKEYSSYNKVLSRVIDKLRICYPNADLLLLGVGDRGYKNGTVYESLSTLNALVKAQRDCARSQGILFWDTKAAMQGYGNISKWRNDGLVNADYVHLNHKGGAVLADEFVKSLNLMLGK